MTENLSLSQCLPKLLGIVELRYFHVGAADFPNNMGIAAGCGWQVVPSSKLKGSCRVPQQHSTGIEDLYGVYIWHYPVQRLATKRGTPSKAVVGVWNTHQPALCFNSCHCLLRGETARYLLFKEKTDDLALGGEYLLADNDFERSKAFNLEGSGNGVVVGHCQAVYSALDTVLDNLFWRG